MQRISPSRTPARFTRHLAAILTLAACCTFLAGATALVRHDPQTAWSFNASAGVVLILVAIVQSRMAVLARREFIADRSGQLATNFGSTNWLRQHVQHPPQWAPDARRATGAPFSAKIWLRQLLVGGLACYLMALAIGPGFGIEWAFAAAVAVCVTLTLLPLAAQPKALEGLRKLAQGRQARRIGNAAYVATLALIGFELALRASASLPNVPPTAGTAQVASAGNVAADARGFRVAIIGGEMANGTKPVANHLPQLKTLSPGIDVEYLGGASVGYQPESASLADDIRALRPNLVLALVRPSDVMQATAPSADPFDWRNVRLGQCVARILCGENHPLNAPACGAGSPGRDSLESEAEKFAVCRVPIDPSIQRRWQRAFAELDSLISECQRAQVNIALVLAPEDFQVNTVLFDTLRRRLGYAKQDVDLDLPQRRLAAFASQRGVPVLDLLPQLRASDQPTYAPSKSDWNDQGSAVVAQTISGWLHERYATQIAAGTAQFATHERIPDAGR